MAGYRWEEKDRTLYRNCGTANITVVDFWKPTWNPSVKGICPNHPPVDEEFMADVLRDVKVSMADISRVSHAWR